MVALPEGAAKYPEEAARLLTRGPHNSWEGGQCSVHNHMSTRAGGLSELVATLFAPESVQL